MNFHLMNGDWKKMPKRKKKFLTIISLKKEK
jgi:hypothetical protein